MTTKNLWWKTHESKLNLLLCHLHEQVGKYNTLIDLFVKLKCQFHTLGSRKTSSQARAGWVFLKEVWQMLWKCTAKESNLSVFTQLFCWRTHVPLMECLNLSFLHLNWEFKFLSSILNAVKEGSQRQIPFPVLFFNNKLLLWLFWQHSQISVRRLILWWKSHGGFPSCIQPNLLVQRHCSWKSNKSDGWDHTMITPSLTTLLM